MPPSDFTPKQLAFQRLIGEFLADYAQSHDPAALDEFLQYLDSPERDFAIQDLFRHSLESRDWPLAERCVLNGYEIIPSEDDLADCGPLHDVLYDFGNCPDVIEWLLAHGVEVDRRGYSNVTPLMSAAGKGYLEVPETLIAHGADVNLRTLIDDNETALMVAAEQCHEEIVRLLLEKGADAGRRSLYGKTAAQLAEAKGHQAIAALIRKSERG